MLCSSLNAEPKAAQLGHLLARLLMPSGVRRATPWPSNQIDRPESVRNLAIQAILALVAQNLR